MNVINSRRIPFVSSNGTNLRINVAAQKLLCYAKYVDIEIDEAAKIITIKKNDENGEYKATYFNRRQCQICIYSLFNHTALVDKTRYLVQGLSEKIVFSYS